MTSQPSPFSQPCLSTLDHTIASLLHLSLVDICMEGVWLVGNSLPVLVWYEIMRVVVVIQTRKPTRYKRYLLLHDIYLGMF